MLPFIAKVAGKATRPIAATLMTERKGEYLRYDAVNPIATKSALLHAAKDGICAAVFTIINERSKKAGKMEPTTGSVVRLEKSREINESAAVSNRGAPIETTTINNMMSMGSESCAIKNAASDDKELYMKDKDMLIITKVCMTIVLLLIITSPVLYKS